MSEFVIRVQGLGKSYRLWHRAQERRYIALRDVVSDRAKAITRFVTGKASVVTGEEEEFWALRDVSFDVREGEVLGIIGRNGAGKSTLLKVLSRVTEPTEGVVRIRGRVASLLEVGTGFHPELSGRENIFLNGTILGMNRAEIRRKFDEIVAFAEIDRFVDTPVKRYSSGMYVRLAFSIAAHLDQEILIVDEVLAVGDAKFQRKCLGKMRNLATSAGRTVLFVSHNLSAVQALCANALRLDQGRSLGILATKRQIENYLSEIADQETFQEFAGRKISRLLRLDDISFSPNPAESGADISFRLQMSSVEQATINEICVLIYSNLGVRVAILDLRSGSEGYRLDPNAPLELRGKIRNMRLVEGVYSIGLYVNADDFQEDIRDVLTLTVFPPEHAKLPIPYAPEYRGLVELPFEFSRI